MKIYGVVGTSQQTIVSNNIKYSTSQNEILMKSERPTAEHIAKSDGTWGLPQPTKERQLQQLESDYQTAVTELQKSLNIAQLRDDTALIEDIRNDFSELQTAYQAEKEAIENVASAETV